MIKNFFFFFFLLLNAACYVVAGTTVAGFRAGAANDGSSSDAFRSLSSLYHHMHMHEESWTRKLKSTTKEMTYCDSTSNGTDAITLYNPAV
jgi:hypothetical protein